MKTDYTFIFSGLEIKDNIGLFFISLVGIAAYCFLVQFLSTYKFKKAFSQGSKSGKLALFSVDITNSTIIMYLLMTLSGYVIIVTVVFQILANFTFKKVFKIDKDISLSAEAGAERLI